MGIGLDLKDQADKEKKMSTKDDDDVVFEAVAIGDGEVLVTEQASAEGDVKAAINAVAEGEGKDPRYVDEKTIPCPPVTATKNLMKTLDSIEADEIGKVVSDGSTAAYYELPSDAKELQDLISFKNMNAQMGEIGRAWYRYGEVEHSEKMRDAKKIKFYIEAEIARLEKYGE